jgi:shikimate kinase
MIPDSKRLNVTLIGMPGSGKTTVGQHLARHWGWTFFDTDHFIERGEGKTLEQIIDEHGHAAFLQVEASYIGRVAGQGQVISTGGSVVYNTAAMHHLLGLSTVVYLNVPLTELERRLGNLKARGVVIAPGMTIADLWRDLSARGDRTRRGMVVAREKLIPRRTIYLRDAPWRALP